MSWKIEWWKYLPWSRIKKKKKKERNEESLRHLWDNIKCANIRIIGLPEEEEKGNGPEKIYGDYS